MPPARSRKRDDFYRDRRRRKLGTGPRLHRNRHRRGIPFLFADLRSRALKRPRPFRSRRLCQCPELDLHGRHCCL